MSSGIFDGATTSTTIFDDAIFDTLLKVVVVRNPIEAFIPDRTTEVEADLVG